MGEGAAEMHPLWTIWGNRPEYGGNRPECGQNRIVLPVFP